MARPLPRLTRGRCSSARAYPQSIYWQLQTVATLGRWAGRSKMDSEGCPNPNISPSIQHFCAGQGSRQDSQSQMPHGALGFPRGVSRSGKRADGAPQSINFEMLLDRTEDRWLHSSCRRLRKITGPRTISGSCWTVARKISRQTCGWKSEEPTAAANWPWN